MNGVLTVMVREAKKFTTNLLIAQIALSIICIPLSIIHSFSFAFIRLDPKSGGTEKGMTVPPQVYHKNHELQAMCMPKGILGKNIGRKHFYNRLQRICNHMLLVMRVFVGLCGLTNSILIDECRILKKSIDFFGKESYNTNGLLLRKNRRNKYKEGYYGYFGCPYG